MTSVIHDIGYRSYQGPRLGRAYAIRSLFTHNLRAAYGLGRPAKAKVMPFLLFAIMILPAIGSIATTALATDAPLIRYSAYAIYLQVVVAIFLAAQSPVLGSRDLRFSVLPLYFSRPPARLDYVLAKYAAMTAALFILLATPVTLLFGGALVTRQKHPGDHALHFAAGLAGCLIFALVLAGIGLVVAAFTPRRGLGVTGVMAIYLISNAAASIVQATAEHTQHYTLARWGSIITPFDLVDGVQVWALRQARSAPELPPGGIGGPVFALVCALIVACSIGILLLRFRKAGSR